MKQGTILIAAALLWPQTAVRADSDPLTVSAFVDTYLGHDFNVDSRKRPYTTQAYYQDEPALNLAYVDAKLAAERFRGRLALQYGSSVISNYSAEPDTQARYFQEANLGVRVADSLWLDAGIFLSHLGPESWISRDNPTYTRSLLSEYSPYYQSGARLIYQPSDDLTLGIHALRGWQNISADRDPALGIQSSYAFTKALTLSYNNFIGNEDGRRSYHDFIAKLQPSDRLNLTVAFDIGEQHRAAAGDHVWWYAWTALAQYKLSDGVSLGGRLERFVDPHAVVAAGTTQNSFRPYGASINVDVALLEHLIWRTEYRLLHSSRAIFSSPGGGGRNESLIVTSLSYTVQ